MNFYRISHETYHNDVMAWAHIPHCWPLFVESINEFQRTNGPCIYVLKPISITLFLQIQRGINAQKNVHIPWSYSCMWDLFDVCKLSSDLKASFQLQQCTRRTVGFREILSAILNYVVCSGKWNSKSLIAMEILNVGVNSSVITNCVYKGPALKELDFNLLFPSDTLWRYRCLSHQ